MAAEPWLEQYEATFRGMARELIAIEDNFQDTLKPAPSMGADDRAGETRTSSNIRHRVASGSAGTERPRRANIRDNPLLADDRVAVVVLATAGAPAPAAGYATAGAPALAAG